MPPRARATERLSADRTRCSGRGGTAACGGGGDARGRQRGEPPLLPDPCGRSAPLLGHPGPAGRVPPAPPARPRIRRPAARTNLPPREDLAGQARALSLRRRHDQHACSWGHRPPLLPTPRRVRTRGSPAANRKEPATALLLKQARCDASPPHPRQSGAVPCTEGDLNATVGHRSAGAAVVVGRQRPGARGTAPAHAPAKRRFGSGFLSDRNCNWAGFILRFNRLR